MNQFPGIPATEVPLDVFWNLHQLCDFKPSTDISLPAFKVEDVRGSLNSVCALVSVDIEDKRIEMYKSKGTSRSKDGRPRFPDYFGIQGCNLEEGEEPDEEKLSPFTLEFVVEQRDATDSNVRVSLGRHLSTLLKLRPDLLVAQGLTVSPDTLTFVFAVGGYGISYTSVPLGHQELDVLLYAFLHRAHVRDDDNPNPTIKRIHSKVTQDTVFDITMMKGDEPLLVCHGYTLDSAYSPFDQRSHIFTNTSTPATLDGHEIRVIKDQYCHPDSLSHESAAFERIQAQGKIPGVVFCVYSDQAPCKLGPRTRIRIAMDQCGTTFLNAATVKHGLCLLYDLLEATRFLQKDSGILHRDLSTGNILIDPSAYQPMSDAEKRRLSPLRYSASMLDPSKSQWQTDLLLIDFGISDVPPSGPDEEPKRVPIQTGTPLFMARAVMRGASCKHVRAHTFPEMPPAPEVYQRVHEDRVTQFPVDENTPIIYRQDRAAPPRVLNYELRYDAEAVFWVLWYWLLCIQPADGKCDDEPFRPAPWISLHGSSAERHCWLVYLSVCHTDALHSRFEPLAPLLTALALQLQYDTYILDSSNPEHATMTQPDYIHEAFQRLILSFIIDNASADFMNTPISDTLRRMARPDSECYSTIRPRIKRNRLDTGLDEEPPQRDGKGTPQTKKPRTRGPAPQLNSFLFTIFRLGKHA